MVILLVITLNTVLDYVQESRAEESLKALRNDVHRAIPRAGAPSVMSSGSITPICVPATSFSSRPVTRYQPSRPSGRGGARCRWPRRRSPVSRSPSTRPPKPSTTRPPRQQPRRHALHEHRDHPRPRRHGGGQRRPACTPQIGKIAGLLGSAGTEQNPRCGVADRSAGDTADDHRDRRGRDRVRCRVCFVASRGTTCLLTAVSLAVATIPEGLTAVVAFTLSRWVRRGWRNAAPSSNSSPRSRRWEAPPRSRPTRPARSRSTR